MTQVQEHWQQGRNARNSPDTGCLAGEKSKHFVGLNTYADNTQLSAARGTILGTYLVVLAVPVHHPVLAVGADLQLEVGDVVRLLRLLGDGALCGDARQDFEELEVDLRREQWSRTLQTQS